LLSQIVRFCQCAEPALELSAPICWRCEGLRRDRLQDRQRVLDAVVKLLDNRSCSISPARSGRHPHREGKAISSRTPPMTLVIA